MQRRGPSPDVLSDVLGSLNLKGTLYFTTEFSPPWGVRVPSLADVARFHLVMRGACWVRTDGEPEPVFLESGDFVLVPHGAGHVLSDDPKTPAVQVDEVIRRSGFDGRGAVVFGGDDRGKPTRLLCGHCEFDEVPSHPFLKRLPRMIVIRHEEAARHAWVADVFRSIAGEAREMRPGSEAIVTRLSEVLFIQAVRVWAETSRHAPGVMTALGDPGIGRSLAALHGDPARDWTLESLAREAGLSRTGFAEKFRRLMELTPMQYVAFWRMQQARPLLERGDVAIDDVAGRVGYASTAAFCRVFRKWVGVTPGRYRRDRKPGAPRKGRGVLPGPPA